MSMRFKIRKTKYAEHPIRYDMIYVPEQFNVDINNRLAELIIVDEMTPNELWENINTTTAKVAKEKLSRKRFRKKQWISEETLDLIDERINMKAHMEERQQSGIQREIPRHQKGMHGGERAIRRR